MRTLAGLAFVALLGVPKVLAAGGAPVPDQARRGRVATPRPTPPAMPTPVAAHIQCPSPLGTGVMTGRMFCDVLTGREPADGIIVTVPPHTGTAILTFHLHNRHLYSEELIKSGRAYRQYTATIGVLTADNTLLSRAVVQNEFRSVGDLVDRIGADVAGTVKAVAPTGLEMVRIMIPADADTVSILGEKLSVIRPDRTDTFSAPGQPIAIISNVMLEYRPAPARRSAPRR